MNTLFRSIALSRNFQENLATEALHYLLQHTPDSLREKLRVGFASLWFLLPGLSSLHIDRYGIRAKGAASGGYPDLVGYDASEPGHQREGF
jgi:hypothetical protein